MHAGGCCLLRASENVFHPAAAEGYGDNLTLVDKISCLLDAT